MSLIKQLWIGIVLMLLLALGGSFAISIMSAKSYLEEQLRVKNMDNAMSLALSMSQMDKDLVNLELLISAQFDTGHYDYITLTDPQKNILITRQFDEHLSSQKNEVHVPDWFTQLIALDAAPGIAQVQNGWQQYGTLSLKSQSRYVWEALWKSSLRLLNWFLIAAVLCGIIGTIILKFISSPLNTVIKQAEAIGQRQFITSTEPKTTEFQRLVRAMNALSQSVKVMLEKETKQLEKLQREVQLDSLSGLPNRNHFLNLFESKLHRDDSSSSGVVAIIRLLNLSEINHHQGRAAGDHVLLQIAGVLHQFIEHYSECSAGRLNGSDFMIIISGNTSSTVIGTELAEQLNAQLDSNAIENIQLPIAVCNYSLGQKRNEILHRLDGALAQAELKGNRALICLNDESQPIIHRNLSEWREAISHALIHNQLQIAKFPVIDSAFAIIHYEAPVRLMLDKQWHPAGYFMPWAARLGLLPTIDLAVIKTAIKEIQHQSSVAINISAEALCSADFREQTLALLNKSIAHNNYLWIEFPEPCALRHLAELRNFANALRQLGCKIGLEHVGLEFTKIRELQDIGLNYLKIDSAIIRDIQNNEGNQHFLQGLCKIGQSLGMLIIAEGVKTQEEKVALFNLNIDAITGPAVAA